MQFSNFKWVRSDFSHRYSMVTNPTDGYHWLPTATNGYHR